MSGMTGPVWLAAILGAVMLAAAVASLARIVIPRRAGKATDYQIEAHNVLMGVSMAGMLLPGLLIVTAGPSSGIWLVVWSLITLWFLVTVIRDATAPRDGRRFTGHHVPHLVMAGAMVYMFAVIDSMGSSATAGGGTSNMAGMGGMAGGAALVPWPTLDYGFVLFMLGYAVLVIDRLPALVGGATAPLAPRGEAAINIAMALTMGYMLVMMFA